MSDIHIPIAKIQRIVRLTRCIVLLIFGNDGTYIAMLLSITLLEICFTDALLLATLH